MFASLYSKLKGKLENIDKSTLRGEYKCNIYSRYALPSIRFYFSIHQIHKSHKEQLDSLARSYLKKWLDIQKHGVTDAAIFHPYMLCVKAPSKLYNTNYYWSTCNPSLPNCKFRKKLEMVRSGGGLPLADCLLKKGEVAKRPILRSAVLATVHMWVGSGASQLWWRRS